MMKKYNLNQILLEGEATLASADEKNSKILSPKFQKLINAASISAAGASACLLYMNRELLISGFNGFALYMTKLIQTDQYGFFGKIFHAISSVVYGAIGVVKTIVSGIGNAALAPGGLSGEIKDILSSRHDTIISIGVVLGIAALGAAICIGLYKIFKVIKNKLTESSINISDKQLSNIIRESKNEIKKCAQHVIVEGDSNASVNKADSIVKKAINKIKEMWNWVLTSENVRKTSLGIVFACLITLGAAVSYSYLGWLNG